MRWLLFLSRLGIICGIFFLLTLSLLVKEWTTDQSLVSTIVTIGFFMGLIVVPVTLLCYLFLWMAGKKPGSVVPKWIIAGNILALLILLGYIYYRNSLAAQMEL
jgi:heme/copper-type cytochrome/quinol oxidase subunit 4